MMIVFGLTYVHTRLRPKHRHRTARLHKRHDAVLVEDDLKQKQKQGEREKWHKNRKVEK